MAESDQAITQLLSAIDSGASVPPERLFSLIYDELRSRAARLMRGERHDHTLQPTALVNEAFMKVARPGVSFESRVHFFNAASLAMRRILVDHAKARKADKRGGAWEQVSLGDVTEQAPPVDVLALDEALSELARLSPRQAQVVQLRFFGGLSEEEAAELLGVSGKTVRRDWSAARLWLHDRMNS